MPTPLGCPCCPCNPFNSTPTIDLPAVTFDYPDYKKYHGLHTWAFGLIIAFVVALVLGFISIFLMRRSSPSPPANEGAAPLPPPEEHLVDVSLVEREDPGKPCASDGEDSGKKKNVESEKKRFAQTNVPRIHQLWRTLCILQQEPDTSVTSLYTNFKGLMDELSELQPLPQCNCGASKEMAQRERDLQVHLFLGSLDNERFGQVKETLLNTDPLPSLHCVFNHVLREEARFVAEKDKGPITESGAAFYTSKGKSRADSEGGSAHLPCAEEIESTPSV